MNAPGEQFEMVQPVGAPEQKARVLEWLQRHPDGLTQLQAFQELAVARLAAIVHRLRGDGHTITTELVEMPTRYGPAQVARYHLLTREHGAVRPTTFTPAADPPAREPAPKPAPPVRTPEYFEELRRKAGLVEMMRCGCGHTFDGSKVGALGCANCNGDEGPAERVEA